MISFKNLRILVCALAYCTFLFIGSAQAQKYKTLDDTVKLNKEYGEITLDIAKLNAKLIAEKNKTVDFQNKTSSTATEAVTSAQDSKNQAATATNGNTTDTKQAVKDAKKADRKANDAKNAVADEKSNNKKINKLTEQIEKKQKNLTELDQQRAVIMLQLTPTSANEVTK